MSGRDWIVVVGVATAVFLVLRCIRDFGDRPPSGPVPCRDGWPSRSSASRCVVESAERDSVGRSESGEELLRRAFGDLPP